ncbi:MAG: class I SAM-dependent methyltransferase [Gemmatimonadota bacterium]
MTALLTELADKYGTDKGGKFHRYTDFYELLFNMLNFEPARVLEIGVDRGHSLRMWQAYWPHAKVIGLDHRSYAANAFGGYITTVRGDQALPKGIGRIGDAFGPFDLVLDDGSHFSDHQHTSFLALWPHVAPSGLYICEDLDCMFNDDFRRPGKTFMDVFTFRMRVGDPGWLWRTAKGSLTAVLQKEKE